MTQRVVAVSVAKGPTIMLASVKLFDFLDPHGSDFDIDDIAHSLAHICRYSGQCRAFYSVAEHSILVADTVAEFGYEALLHDSAEAFIGDVTRRSCLRGVPIGLRRPGSSQRQCVFVTSIRRRRR